MKRIIIYDMKKGVLHMWPRFVLSGVLLLLLSMAQARQVRELVGSGVYSSPSFGNYLAVWLKGMDEMALHIKDVRQIALPVEWLMLQFNYMFLMVGYIQTDLKRGGCQLILRASGRRSWWISKCIWSAAATAVYYLMFYAILACISKTTGGLALMPQSEIWISDLEFPSERRFLFVIFVMLPVSSFTAGLAQILVELASSPAVALAAGCGYQFAVLYWSCPLLVGNYAMLYRSNRFAGTGASLALGLCICIVFLLCIYAAGCYYVKRMEF